jgi:predicted MarR family transcription regulator
VIVLEGGRVSTKAKKIFKGFLAETESAYSATTGKFLEQCKSATTQDIEMSETYKGLNDQYEALSRLLAQSLSPKQLDLFCEIEEIICHESYVGNDIAYMNGLRDGFLLYGRYIASLKI